jgi:biotin carboxylase
MSAAEGVVLVIGCGRRPYREYLLASAATRHPLWLFNESEITWQHEHVVGGTVVDLLDLQALLTAARGLAADRPVLGVLSWDEMLIVNTARVADVLGLPGPGLSGVESCRDKVRGRRVLAAAMIDQPVSAYVRDQARAVAAAERIGYPVIVKPRGLAASFGVRLVGDAEGAAEAFRVAESASQVAAPAYRGGALVEEYLDGPEVSIDGAAVNGRYIPLFIARKTMSPPPYFEETGHTVDAADELLADRQLLDMLARAHLAIEFRYGITHTEVKLTKRGPVIVEINGRIAGDLIPLLARYSTGIEPGAAAVSVALGVSPQVPPAAAGRCAGVRFAYPPHDCVVESVSVPPARPDQGLLASVALADPGTTLELPPAGFISRHAYLIASGRDAGECTAVLDRALSEVRLAAHPLAPSLSVAPGG